MRKFSRQREMILQYLLEKKNHPTAEQIYTALRSQLPSLSLATVYRNLNLLCELGFAQRLDTGESEDRFDADTSEHSHFICEVCHDITDIPDSMVTQQMESALGEGFQVKRRKLFLYGLCPCCHEQKKKAIS